MVCVDLNCDLGEGFGRYKIGSDEKLMDYVTSVNIACGFHAGDPVIMERTVKMALSKGVAIGAHPGYPDLIGFGRRNMQISHEEARAYIIYQIGALKSFVEVNGGKLQHVKFHGALYNTAAKDYWLARAMADAIYRIDKNIILIGLANSAMLQAAAHAGLRIAHEVFADRQYNRDGTLVSREEEGALIHDVDCCINRVAGILKEGKVRAKCGTDIEVKADSICIHGDNDNAVEFAKVMREGLQSQEVRFKSLSNI
jgi:UPF0271 protein